MVSIYSRNSETARKIAAKYNGILCEQLEEAILMDGVDCVYIATPHSSHFDYVIQCLNLGLPVLCEKPVCMGYSDVNRIIETSEQNKTYFSEIMSFKFSPIFQETKSIIKQGFLGDLLSVQADIGFDAFSRTKRKRLLSAEEGGGALFDIGVYLISFVEDFLGATNVIDNTAIYYKKSVDIVDNVILKYGNIKCELECRFDRITVTQAKMNFENGSITIPRFFQPRNIIIKYENETLTLENSFSHKYQFDCTANDIIHKKISSNIHTNASIINTVKMLEKIKCVERSNFLT